MEPVRFGVLGCASIARRKMLPAMLSVPSVRVVAVASRAAATARQVADEVGADPVVGYEALLTRNDVEAVYLPLPAGLHRAWAARALRTGHHVLVEKPLTTTLAGAYELVRLARERRLLLMESFMFLHHRQHAAVRAMLAAGAVGQVRSYTGAFTIPPLPPTDIRYSPALGGGALLDVGGYPLRAATMVLGSGLRVVGASLRYGVSGVDVAGAALLAAPDRRTAQVAFGFENAYRSAYEVWGSTGRLVVERAFTPPAGFAPTATLTTAGGSRPVDLPPDDQFARIADSFATAVRAGADVGSQEEDILTQAGLVHAVRRCAARAAAI